MATVAQVPPPAGTDVASGVGRASEVGREGGPAPALADGAAAAADAVAVA